jgi:hypothetical protein
VRVWLVYLTPKIERIIVLLSASPEGEARCRCRKVWLTRNDYYYVLVPGLGVCCSLLVCLACIAVSGYLTCLNVQCVVIWQVSQACHDWLSVFSLAQSYCLIVKL